MSSAKVLRTLIVVASALAAWVIATPARAAAPYCDARGASAIAAPPMFPTDGATLDADETADAAPCSDRAEAGGPTAHQGDAPLPEPPAGTYATLPGVHLLAPRLVTMLPGTRSGAQSGDAARGRLERPPRPRS